MITKYKKIVAWGDQKKSQGIEVLFFAWGKFTTLNSNNKINIILAVNH